MASPLLISANVINMSAMNMATYKNKKVIAVNQDPLGKAATRIDGNDLEFPCSGQNCTNVWGRELSGGRLAVVFVTPVLLSACKHF